MIKIQKKLSGFTLMELLIVIAFVGILATVVIVLINPLAQLDRARVAKGKSFYAQVTHSLDFFAVGTWKFDDASNHGKDTSGNNNNGTLVNVGTGSVSYQPNCDLGLGSCLNFVGDSLNGGYVSVPNSSSLRVFETNSWSYAVWFKVSSNGDAHGLLQALPDRPYIFIQNDRTIRMTGGDVDGSPWEKFKTDVNVFSWNTWTFLTITGDGTLFKVYVNGDKVKTAPFHRFNAWTSSLYFGRAWNLTNLLNGYIDEVNIYTSALAQAEIQKKYAEGLRRISNLSME